MRQGQFGCRDGVSFGSIHYDDAARGGCFDIDVVDSHPGPADRLQFRGARNQLGIDPGTATDDYAAHFGNAAKEPAPLPIEGGNDLKSRFIGNPRDAALGDRIGDEDFLHDCSVTPVIVGRQPTAA